MKITVIAALLSLSFISVVSASEVTGRDPNLFSINGQTYEVPDELLAKLRKSWKDAYIDHGPTKVPATDQQWVMDFIRIVQMAASQGCEELSLNSIEPFKSGYKPLTDKEVTEIGNFDEIWTITACARLFYYRVTHDKARNDLEVMQIQKITL